MLLRECPFCGGDGVWVLHPVHGASVQCGNKTGCSLMPQTNYYSDGVDAAGEWNRRAGYWMIESLKDAGVKFPLQAIPWVHCGGRYLADAAGKELSLGKLQLLAAELNKLENATIPFKVTEDESGPSAVDYLRKKYGAMAEKVRDAFTYTDSCGNTQVVTADNNPVLHNQLSTLANTPLPGDDKSE
jgi:hypothetical protein